MTIDSKLAEAQQAIALPEVQEMVRRLAAYGLGVSLPHMHDLVGNMLPLPEGMMQVEGDDLRATFLPADQVVDSPDRGVRYLPVGWRWSAQQGKTVSTMACPIVYNTQKKQYEHTGYVRDDH